MNYLQRPNKFKFQLFFSFVFGVRSSNFNLSFLKIRRIFMLASWNTHKMFLSQCMNNCLCLLMIKRILCFAQKTKMGIKFKFQLLTICILSPLIGARNSIGLFFYFFTLIHILKHYTCITDHPPFSNSTDPLTFWPESRYHMPFDLSFRYWYMY